MDTATAGDANEPIDAAGSGRGAARGPGQGHAQPRGRARRRALTLSLALDDDAFAPVLRALERVARQADPRARLAVADPVHELPWTELSFLAVDVETTGFTPARDRVLEIGWVRFERGREVERFSSLVSHDDCDVPAAVRRITGIHPSMLDGKPSFAGVARGLLEALADVDFAVAYNAPFDRAFLAAELERCGLALADMPWVDPLGFVREVERAATPASSGARLPKNLVDVARRFGVALPGAHRAENDARATGELLLRLAPRLRARTLADLVDTQARWQRLPAASPPAAADGRDDDDAPGLGARLLALFR